MIRQWKVAGAVTWLIVSLVILAVLASPFAVPAEHLLKVSARLHTPHETPCPLCGMTRAFIALSRGDVREARALNPGALPLSLLLAANQVAFIIFLFYGGFGLLFAKKE